MELIISGLMQKGP